MPSPVTLPTATIQDDFTTVLSEVHAGIIPSEKIWLSCYKGGEPSVHGKISVSLHEQDRDRVELVGSRGVELTRTSQVSITASKGPHLFVRPSARCLISSPGANASSGTLPAV
jgi:proteasomal ATPase-associated factor 1